MCKEKLIGYYQDICLLSFVVVILFSNNVITYIILGLVYIINILNKKKKTDYILCLITLLIFLTNSIFLIKIILSIDYVLYFMSEEEKKKNIYFDKIYDKNYKRISKLIGKGDIDNKIRSDIYSKTIMDVKTNKENRLLRFDNSDYYYPNNSFKESYVIFHLIILFLSILIGSCAI